MVPHTTTTPAQASPERAHTAFLAGKKSSNYLYYRFQINCTFLPKSEIFYTADVKNLGVRYKFSL
jgi:hypothetical protein